MSRTKLAVLIAAAIAGTLAGGIIALRKRKANQVEGIEVECPDEIEHPSER